MNYHQKNKLDMLDTVTDFYDNEQGALSTLPAVATVFGNIKVISKEIKENDQIATDGTKARVIAKNAAKEILKQKCLVIAGAIYSYSVDINDEETAALADINSKSLTKLRESEIPGFFNKFIKLATDNAENLVQYGITEEKINDAQRIHDEYVAKFGKVSKGKTTKKGAVKNITALFKTVDKKLKKLDKLMLGIKSVNPEVHRKYESARVIIDKKATHNGGDDSSGSADSNNE